MLVSLVNKKQIALQLNVAVIPLFYFWETVHISTASALYLVLVVDQITKSLPFI